MSIRQGEAESKRVEELRHLHLFVHKDALDLTSVASGEHKHFFLQIIKSMEVLGFWGFGVFAIVCCLFLIFSSLVKII